MSATGRALVVGAAPVAGREEFHVAHVRAAACVIAADGGLALCRRADRAPDACVGDLDSASEEDLRWAEAHGTRLVRFPAEKDVSDLDLAMAEVRALGMTAVDITAAFTGRVAHTVASLGTLLGAADLDVRGIEAAETFHALSSVGMRTVELHAEDGTGFSVYALGAPASVTIEGARYPLRSMVLPPLSALGLDNATQGHCTRIIVEEGTVIVIVQQGLMPDSR